AFLVHRFRPQRQALRAPVAPDFERHAAAWLLVGDDHRNLARGLDALAVDLQNDVAGLQPALGAGRILLDHGDQRAAGAIQTEGFRQLRVDVLDGHADAAARDFAGFDELLLDVVRYVDRNGERQAHVAAAAAINLRVDADHFAAHVEERAAGIARIDRHIRLDERRVVALASRHGAAGGADDAGGDAVLEAER